jgi:cytochrome b
VTHSATAGTEVGRETRPAEAADPTEDGMVRVWDPFVRLFHWSLVALFAAAYLTGDELDRAHEILGYAIVALLVARIGWGFIGSEHARFSDFVRGPSTVLGYARDTIAGKARRYIGHNPLGGVMVLLLIAGLLVTAGTGWLITVGEGESEWLEELHEIAANGMLLLIALHVGGVVWSSVMHGENLVWAMITGQKRAG